LEGFLLAQDIIFVGGGNTRSMMALWREWDLFCILRMAWEQGIVLSGVSAGGNCWFEQGITNSVPGLMGWVACSGIAAGSFCPHFDSQVERRPGYERMLLAGEVQDGYGVDEFAALHLRDDRAPQAVRFGENASVTRMTARNGAVESSALPDLVSLI
ncbi:MAG: Type 1 glutamine amidotransferase-like domain-containing protein, partial [Anaerolineaceae bacterium]|nr:Type 1 glutamine amidotransferase-like domain-containing protein [Anaerolineaceae bacterium]